MCRVPHPETRHRKRCPGHSLEIVASCGGWRPWARPRHGGERQRPRGELSSPPLTSLPYTRSGPRTSRCHGGGPACRGPRPSVVSCRCTRRAPGRRMSRGRPHALPQATARPCAVVPKVRRGPPSSARRSGRGRARRRGHDARPRARLPAPISPLRSSVRSRWRKRRVATDPQRGLARARRRRPSAKATLSPSSRPRLCAVADRRLVDRRRPSADRAVARRPRARRTRVPCADNRAGAGGAMDEVTGAVAALAPADQEASPRQRKSSWSFSR
jgi:hypothetical protein